MIIFLVMLLFNPFVYAQEEADPYAQAISAQQEGNLLQARHHLEEILQHPADVPEIESIEKAWGQVIWQLMRSHIATPETLNYEVKAGDTLGKIAKAYGTTIELIKKRNNLSNNVIREGQILSLWVAPLILDVDKEINRLTVSFNGKTIKTYPVSTGKSETTTPVGEFVIEYRYPNPTWFHHGEIVPPGSPKNFLGTRWLGFNKLKYGIHGTIYPELIGQSVSGGCVRMKNQDVEELYDVISIGTKVVIH